MKYKIYKNAQTQLIKIWQFTEKNWGEDQANNYIYGFYQDIEKIYSTPESWKRIEHDKCLLFQVQKALCIFQGAF